MLPAKVIYRTAMADSIPETVYQKLYQRILVVGEEAAQRLEWGSVTVSGDPAGDHCPGHVVFEYEETDADDAIDAVPVIDDSVIDAIRRCTVVHQGEIYSPGRVGWEVGINGYVLKLSYSPERLTAAQQLLGGIDRGTLAALASVVVIVVMSIAVALVGGHGPWAHG